MTLKTLILDTDTEDELRLSSIKHYAKLSGDTAFIEELTTDPLLGVKAKEVLLTL